MSESSKSLLLPLLSPPSSPFFISNPIFAVVGVEDSFSN
jgi:hypothetical protein